MDKIKFFEWFRFDLPLPHGVINSAEAGYHDDFGSSMYFKRNLLLDFSSCLDAHFKEVEFRSGVVKSHIVCGLLVSYYFEVLENKINKNLSISQFSHENSHINILYCEGFSGVMAFKPNENKPNVWYADFAIII